MCFGRPAFIYFAPRTPLKVPCFEGRSPTSGENSASPVIESGVSNLPLQVNVPASRPTLPSKNSTAPENVISFSSPRFHCASEALDPSQTLDLGSAATKLPFPSASASKRTERCSSFANVISTFQVPITLGDCASLTAMLWVIKIAISTEATLIVLHNSHCRFWQGTKAISANGKMHPATSWIHEQGARASPTAATLGNYGRGPGVGRGLGVGVARGAPVAVAVGVPVAVDVAVAVGVGVGVPPHV